MSLFSQLRSKLSIGRPVKPRNSRNLRQSKDSTRRELIRVALRDTLAKHGVPTAWIASEALNVTRTRAKGAQEPAMHVRFLIRHFEPELLSQGLAVQRTFLKRVSVFDPKADRWLNGVSWQFALLEDNSAHLMAAPSARPSGALPENAAATPLTAPAAADDARAARREPTEAEKMAELSRLFATTNFDQLMKKKGSASAGDFQETRPFNP